MIYKGGALRSTLLDGTVHKNSTKKRQNLPDKIAEKIYKQKQSR